MAFNKTAFRHFRIAVPAYFPDMSKTAYFLSDVHLQLQVDGVEIERRKELFKLMDRIQEEKATLFIVGDWFDFYFEYGEVVSQAYHDVYTKMSDLVRAGVDIHYFAGNHDYWIGKFMTEHLGVKVHLEDEVMEFGGKRIYFHHGDGLDPEDVGYHRLKKVIRHPLFIWAFRWLLHPNIGHWIAKQLSKHSRKKYSRETTQYNLNAIRKNYGQAEDQFSQGVDYMITGHIHYPKIKSFGNHVFLTIGDFINYFTYGYFDGLNLSLKQWPVNQLEQRELP